MLLVLRVIWASLLLLRAVLLLLTRLDVLLLLLLRSLLGSWSRLTVLLLLLLWLRRILFRNFNDNVGWLTNNFSFEAFFRIGGVADSAARGSNEKS